MPGAPAVPTPPPAGSPFVVGRPLRLHEPIFGRDAALRALADALAHGSSANLVAMRRMGKTSLLSHLRGRHLFAPALAQLTRRKLITLLDDTSQLTLLLRAYLQESP